MELRLTLRVFVVLLVLLPASATFAQRQSMGEWTADPTTGCRVWNESPKPKESVRWTGACSAGRAHGLGTLQWFRDGKPGGRYDGEYRDGQMHGRGIYTDAGGSRYDGDWRGGQRHGRGVHTSAGGGRYDGDWRDGERHGRGVLHADGHRYEGEFRYGKPDGSGTRTDPDGKSYSGRWVKGCLQQGDRRLTIGAPLEECGFR